MGKQIGETLVGSAFVMVGLVNCAIGMAIAYGCSFTVSKEVK